MLLQILGTLERFFAYLNEMCEIELNREVWYKETSQTWGLSGVWTVWVVSGGRGEEGRGERTSKMACDMVSLSTGGTAVLPLAGETEVVCAFPTDVCIAEMVVERFWIWERLGTLKPETGVEVFKRGSHG